MNNGGKKYLQNQILTSNPSKLTLMMYEKCILNLRVVHEKINNFRYREADLRIHNTEQIINELFLSINREAFPELADDLYHIYGWLLDELFQLKIKKDVSKIEGMIVPLKNLADAYREVLNDKKD
jgi:flagellar protein FliS